MKKIKNLTVFDLDAVVADSNAVIDTEIGNLLNKLLKTSNVAVITDSDWPHMEEKLISRLPQKQYLHNLVILPLNGTKYYQYRSGWIKTHTENLTDAAKDKIKSDLLKVLDAPVMKTQEAIGEQFLFNENDIVISVLGQKASDKAKQAFDPDQEKRKKIKIALDEALYDSSVRIDGADLIVITKTGINKSHGIYKLHQVLDVKMHRILFIGNAPFKDSNDEAALTTGVECIQVKNLDETKRVIETIIACYNMEHKKQHESI